MFCSRCGKEINKEAVICIYCGVATQNLMKNTNEGQSIVINNSSSASAAASISTSKRYFKRRNFTLFDLIMTIMTCGFWLIWVFIRPKYY